MNAANANGLQSSVPGEADLIALYRTMLLIRRFEERCNALFLQGRIPSTLHLYIGQEAVATGVCSALRADDWVVGTHRPHGHALAKGVSPRVIMAELMAKVTGCCRGKGGSMHVGDVRKGVFPAVAIVGAGLPIAAGAALSARMRGTDQVAVAFHGEGAANEGDWHEALNMAAIWKLPVLFVCENNLYGASTHFSKAFAIPRVSDRACAYGMPGETVDGNDVVAVHDAALRAVERARSGAGPTLLECLTYRQCGHSRSDACDYRPDEEEALWKERDPLKVAAARIRALVPPVPFDPSGIEADVAAEIDDAIAFAEESPAPAPEDLERHVYWEGD
ncbi:MAG: thiamine pyrophosphate-dependent dehydrogenase E1 component subunit alpha [Chthonomonadales bacterium]|nr:thiamine pyrophosphate-dependent dehydrogenase E1 component subunit alpha [Chthonomonadales bacterium]